KVSATDATVMEVTSPPGETTSSTITWAQNAEEKLDENSALIGTKLAERLGLGPTDLMPEVSVGGKPVRIIGTIESDRSPTATGALFITRNVAANLGESISGSVDVKTVPGAARTVAQKLPLLADPYASTKLSVSPVLQPDSYRGALQDSVAVSLLVLAAVASLAGLGAVILVNVLSVNARIPEFGVRRAFGARRKGIVMLVVGECATLGLIGAIVGLTLGFVTIMAVTAIARWQPVFDPQLLAIPLAGAILFGTLGAIPSAIAAGRIEPAAAVRT